MPGNPRRFRMVMLVVLRAVLLGAAALVIAAPASAQNCSILTGGNPCTEGCPDECSPILCPGNRLCKARCGGSSCNITCNPGPCGAGCPDECSPILCPGNRLCKARCGGSSCNVTCSPGPCGAGCPDECSPILCPQNPCACAGTGEGCLITANCCDDLVCAFPQQVCRHDPPQLGEPCGPAAPCRDGLRCITLICREPRQIGEGCLVGSDCADELDCRPCFVQGCRSPLMCFPRGEARRFDEPTCRGFHSVDLQRAAIDARTAMSYGYGSALAAGIGGSFEIGTVYGQDGSYGCFLTTCTGAIVDVEIASFVCIGFFRSFAEFQESAVAIVEEAGEGLAFSTSQILGPNGALVGTEDCLSIEASVAPITAGVFDCDTAVTAVPVSLPPTTTTTLPAGVTTSTVIATPSTSTTVPTIGLPRLLDALGKALPDPGAEVGARRRLAKKLVTLHRRAQRQLLRALDLEGGRQRRLYEKGGRALRKLLQSAERGAEAGRLGVPLRPIQAIVGGLQAGITTSGAAR